jgi:hypothetical protein
LRAGICPRSAPVDGAILVMKPNADEGADNRGPEAGEGEPNDVHAPERTL